MSSVILVDNAAMAGLSSLCRQWRDSEMTLRVRAIRAPVRLIAAYRTSTALITTAADICCQLRRSLTKNPPSPPQMESCVRPTDEHDDPLLTLLEKIPAQGPVFGRDAAIIYLMARASSK